MRQHRTPPRCWYRDVEGCEEIIGGHGLVLKLTIGTGFRQLPTGLGECQLSRGGHSTAAAVRSSSGKPQLTNAFLFALTKAVVVLFAPCFCLTVPLGWAVVMAPALASSNSKTHGWDMSHISPVRAKRFSRVQPRGRSDFLKVRPAGEAIFYRFYYYIIF